MEQLPLLDDPDDARPAGDISKAGGRRRVANRWVVDDRTRRIGRDGLRQAREALTRAAAAGKQAA